MDIDYSIVNIKQPNSTSFSRVKNLPETSFGHSRYVSLLDNRDEYNKTLLNPSLTVSTDVIECPTTLVDQFAAIPIPPGLTDLGIYHWTKDKDLIPDWRKFPKQRNKCQGLKNLVKMLNSPIGFRPPQSEKQCKKCLQNMCWTENAGILLNRGASSWNWGNQHNGNCLKIYSQEVKGKVEYGERCHNPRCSEVNPTFFWEKNLKLYCTVECCDGYQEWNQEVRNSLHHYPNALLSRNGINGWGYGLHFVEEHS